MHPVSKLPTIKIATANLLITGLLHQSYTLEHERKRMG